MTRIVILTATLLSAGCITFNGQEYRARETVPNAQQSAFATTVRSFANANGFTIGTTGDNWDEYELQRDLPDHSTTQWLDILVEKAGETNTARIHETHSTHETAFKKEIRLLFENALLSAPDLYDIEWKVMGSASHRWRPLKLDGRSKPTAGDHGPEDPANPRL